MFRAFINLLDNNHGFAQPTTPAAFMSFIPLKLEAQFYHIKFPRIWMEILSKYVDGNNRKFSYFNQYFAEFSNFQ